MKFIEILKKLYRGCRWIVIEWLKELERYGENNTSSLYKSDFTLPDDSDFALPRDATICAGGLPGDPRYCIRDGRIYEGPVLSDKCIASIGDDGRIYEGYFPVGNCIANIDSDGKIYKGYFRGDCVGCINDGKVYLGGAFPTSTPDYNIL